MDDIPEYDPTRDDEGAAGGGDDDTQNWSLSGGPTEAPDEQKSRWRGGARPKDPYRYERVPQHDKDTPMSTFPKEKSGLPSTSKGTAETSFIEGMPSGRVKNMDSLKM